MKVRQKKVVRIDEGGVETTSNTTNAKVAVSSTSKMENDLSTSSEEKTETEDMEALKPVVEMEEGETKAKGETQVEGDTKTEGGTKTEGDTQAEGDTKTVQDSGTVIKLLYLFICFSYHLSSVVILGNTFYKNLLYNYTG